MESTALQTDALFRQYLHNVNQALGSSDVYRKMVKLGDKALGHQEINAHVYGDDPAAPSHSFVLQFNGRTFDLVEEGKRDDAMDWNVPRAHMEEVVANPKPFLKNPAKLDLNWMKERLGLG